MLSDGNPYSSSYIFNLLLKRVSNVGAPALIELKSTVEYSVICKEQILKQCSKSLGAFLTNL